MVLLGRRHLLNHSTRKNILKAYVWLNRNAEVAGDGSAWNGLLPGVCGSGWNKGRAGHRLHKFLDVQTQ